MNISDSGGKTYHKLQCLLSNKTDIILVCDLRLNSEKQTSAVECLTKKSEFLGYDFLHNSKTSLRGVGMFISKKIPYEVIEKKEDIHNNYLLFKIKIQGKTIILGSIYGPNTNDDMEFYDNFSTALSELNTNNCDILVGGDWNCTWDPSPADINQDVTNMASIPSKRRSEKLRTICTLHKITDPYRVMYPNKRDFTYIPAVLEHNNRSRLDFFLLSECRSGQIGDCNIPNSLSSTVFDHKPIKLTMYNTKKFPKNKQVLAKNVKNFELCTAVLASAKECYLHNAQTGDRLSIVEKNNLLLMVGDVNRCLNDINTVTLRNLNEPINELYKLELEGLKTNLEILAERLPTLEFFEQLPLECNEEYFFESLCNDTRNAALREQTLIFKQETELENVMNAEINVLKMDPQTNQNLIFQKERSLTIHLENKRRNELIDNKKFEIVNSEKMTPYFMGLVKRTKTEADLSEVTSDQGLPFGSENERTGYIVDSFADLYKRTPGENINENSLNNFLGETSQNNIIRNSKLTNEERDSLETPLLITELDQSINNANLKSAPGADGFSNRFIKQFWHIYRMPLFKLANKCFEDGSLTNSFKTANIKLIPKKGNLKLLKNWRPISLLNCFYKIISRAIGSRLKKFMDKLTPVSQKGYSRTRRCQEVLINLIEGIAECKKNRYRGAIVSLDIRKAFDTISHAYNSAVLDFYNFGPTFKRWLTLLSTGRKACIILSENKLSPYFDLERGNAQGDILSPFLFLLGYQILLFKLQFDLQIEGISILPAVPAGGVPLPNQVNNCPLKVLAMADDANCLVRLDCDNLVRIKNVLDSFGRISGLECNIDKTVVIPVGHIEEISQQLRDTGFSFANSATILGVEVSNNMEGFVSAAEKIKTSLRKQVNFWVRFRLSLPGRINIAKSMLYSQINYTGCFIPFSPEQLSDFSLIIENFVKGGLNIAKKRIFSGINFGGLGLAELGTFLKAQKCTWFKLALDLDDYWKNLLFIKSNGQILNSRKKWFIDNPVLYSFCEALEDFSSCYTRENENVRDSFLFDNINFLASKRPCRKLDEVFFNIPVPTAWDPCTKLRVSNFWHNNIAIPAEQIVRDTGIDFDNAKLTFIRRICREVIVKNQKELLQQQHSTKIEDFFRTLKKGSKTFKKIMEKTQGIYLPHNTIKYAEITNTVIGAEDSGVLNSIWGKNFLENSVRTFGFKLLNNTLGYNYTVSKYIRDVSSQCTFCALVENPDDLRETPLHLFMQCELTEPVFNDVYTWVLGPDDFISMTRNNFFGRFKFECSKKNWGLDYVNLLFKKYVWNCKQRKSLPNTEYAKTYIKNGIKSAYEISTKFRGFWVDSGINIHF